MTQRKHSLSIGLAFLVVGLMTGVQLAAAKPRPEKANWNNLKQVLPNEEARVVLNGGKSYRGLIEAVTDKDMKIRVAGGELTFAREEVSRVSFKSPSHRGRNAAAGAGIGTLVVGVAISIAAANPLGLAVGAILGGAPGAVIGAVLPTGGWRDVYRVTKESKQVGNAHSGGESPATGR